MAYMSSIHSPSLGIRIGNCGDSACVSWVMPGGRAWFQEVSPGMKVLAINGEEIPGKVSPVENVSNLKLQKLNGEIVNVSAVQEAHEKSPLKFSIWALSTVFAFLGIATFTRRSDLTSTKIFLVFCTLASVAISVLPSSGFPLNSLAIVIQLFSVMAFAVSWIPMTISLTDPNYRPLNSKVVWSISIVGIILGLAYLYAVFFESQIYHLLRPILLLYIFIAIICAIGILAVSSLKQRFRAVHPQMRLVLWGMAMGILPLIILTIIPGTAGNQALAPVSVSVLFLAIIPAAFAYAILQHQMMGIRRLIHRGMVYAISSTVLAGAIALTIGFAVPDTNATSILLIAGLVTFGIVVFGFLRSWVRRLIDKTLYKDDVDLHTFVGAMHRGLATSAQTEEVTREVARSLLESLRLESSLLFLGQNSADAQLAALAGHRSSEVLEKIYPEIKPSFSASSSGTLVELHWQSESLLFAQLAISEKYLGYLLLGPKTGGEIFLSEEMQIIATSLPLIALAIDKGALSEELRQLNQRLLKVEETERSRIAADLHDGPLQNAILLARGYGEGENRTQEVAKQIVTDLREISSRLRPSILDDLGLASALEWLVDGLEKRSGIRAKFTLHNFEEDDRVAREVELVVFRVTQEALNNIVKHSKATSVELTLSRKDSNLTLKISDNGVGFNPSKKSSSGFGLTGVRERVMYVNGSLSVETSPGAGCTLTIQVPAAN